MSTHDSAELGEAEAALDVGQGDVDDGGVEHHHQLGGEDDGQQHGAVGGAARAAARWRSETWTIDFDLSAGILRAKRKLPPLSIRRVPPFSKSFSPGRCPWAARRRQAGQPRAAGTPARATDGRRRRAGRSPAQAGPCGRTPGATTSAWWRRRARSSPTRAAGRRWRRSPSRPASASAPCTGTSPSASTWSRPSTATTSTCWSARPSGG